MELLGSRLRQRRKQLRLQQRNIVQQEYTPSFLSKVETGAAYPSLQTLKKWSYPLDTTIAELVGDQFLLEAAKATILITEKCLGYLAHLPDSPTTSFLRELSVSATSISTPVPSPPRSAELRYLTAKVLIHRGSILEAKELINDALTEARATLWRIHLLFLLCQIHDELDQKRQKRKALKQLQQSLGELDHQKLVHSLPDALSIGSQDLDLLKMSIFLAKMGTIPEFPIKINST